MGPRVRGDDIEIDGVPNSSRERAPDDKLRVPTIVVRQKWWARRKRAFASPTKLCDFARQANQ
jgi:hypothetical protein